ncbi:MAG TPA: NUDIX domain-containing protein, partial [Kribbella sp.]|uniref:NUDIX domain-containing protein n=1 Tax=Kribbella sp. TaxID=1871183 RepID=UPI002D7A093D
MGTPKFILELREKIGHDLLWLPGITGVVLDGEERILLVRRADDGRWSLPAGILEPGEEPAVA